MDTNDLPNQQQIDAALLDTTRQRLALARSLVQLETATEVQYALALAGVAAHLWRPSCTREGLKALHALAGTLVEVLAHPSTAPSTLARTDSPGLVEVSLC